MSPLDGLATWVRAMAKIKCETVRYDVVSCETGEPNIIIQKRYIRSERIGRTYHDKSLRREIRDSHGRVIEEAPGAKFRDPSSGELFEISDFARQMRAVTVAA